MIFPVDAKTLYEHWLDGDKHTAMTGGEATGEPIEGSAFSAWDGYIEGEVLELQPYEYIVQTWRAAEFKEEDEDSVLMVSFKPIEEGTELILEHNNIPEGLTQYEQGWKDHYFEPMLSYFKN